MSRSMKSKTGRKQTATQTHEQEEDPALEIARLQEQVRLLTIENEVLRKYTADKSLVASRDTPRKKSPHEKKVTPENTEQVLQKKTYSQSTTKSAKGLTRGCACKGNCSSKQCGCVKKDNKCGELCKCNNVTCQNQDEAEAETNKENVDAVNIEYSHQEPAEQQGKKNVVNKNLHNVKSGRGLFSPVVDNNEGDFNDMEQFRASSLHFGSAKKLTFISDEENEGTDVEEESEKATKRGKNNEKEPQQRRRRPKKNTLEVSKPYKSRRYRSASNEKKRDKQELIVEMHELRKSASNEMDILSDESNDLVPNQEEKTGNYLKNIMRGMMPLRRERKEMQSYAVTDNATESDEIDMNIASKAEQHTNAEEDQKKKTKRHIKKTVEESRLKSKTNTVSEEKLSTEAKHNKLHTGAEKLPETFDDETLDLYENDPDFDPTKPKHQLPRTPPRSSSESSPVNISDIQLPIPVPEPEEEERPIPPEFYQPQVDWDEYQAQLVACGKCKRKFNPLRIKKHEACCKKV